MAELIFAERFISDAARIYSKKVLNHLKGNIAALERFPNMGSTQIPSSIRREFGNKVRKLAIPPFDLVYEYDEDEDVATVLALIPSRHIT